MLNLKNIAITVFVLLFAGCASLNKSQIYSDISVNTESKLNAEVKVDLSKKLSGSSTAFLFQGSLRCHIRSLNISQVGKNDIRLRLSQTVLCTSF